MPITTYTHEDFIEAHGTHIETGGRYLFVDGATMSYRDGVYAMKDPPDDPFQLLQLKKEYTTEKLKRATNEFNKASNNLLEQARMAALYRNMPAPPDDAPQYLERLRRNVRAWEIRLATINNQIEQSPQMQERRRREAEQERRQAAMGGLAARISAVRLSNE